MDHRCPLCRGNLERRRLSQAIIARMEIDCSHCGRKIRVNVHRAEVVVVILSFVAVVALVTSAYWGSRELMLSAFGAAMLGALAFPVVERIVLRTWPRYASPGEDARR